MNGYVLEESIYIRQIIKLTKFKINLWMQNNKITGPLINQSYQKEKNIKTIFFLWIANTNKFEGLESNKQIKVRKLQVIK